MRHGSEDGMKSKDLDNFANDGALGYLALLTAKLVATISEIVADDDRLNLDEDGESMLMPSVEILALLCERYGAQPPKPAKVRQWSEKYLAVYDATIDRLDPKPAYKTGRRKVIDNTFRWLESLAESYWDR
jgi:hypothetical protein